jgi:hypothetical protein
MVDAQLSTDFPLGKFAPRRSAHCLVFSAIPVIGLAVGAFARLARERWLTNRKDLMSRWDPAQSMGTSAHHGNPARLDDRMPRTYKPSLAEGPLRCPTSSGAKHSPAPGGIRGSQHQAATNSHQNRQPKIARAEVSFPACKKSIQQFLCFPLKRNWQVREITGLSRARLSFEKCHVFFNYTGATHASSEKI